MEQKPTGFTKSFIKLEVNELIIINSNKHSANLNFNIILDQHKYQAIMESSHFFNFIK